MAINRNLIFFIGLLATFTLASFPVIVSGESPLLFTFGDSSYDVGNTKFFSSEFDPATTWPYGESLDDPSGRWSDGLIVPDFVGRLIGNSEPIPPALDPKADLSRGASFAIAGAVVLGSIPGTMNLGQQISKFKELQKKWSDKERGEAIYMLYIGADDYLNFAKDHPNANRVLQIAHVAFVLQRISTDLTSLYRSGARKFAVQNLAPLGCLPIVRQEFKTGESCMEMVNFMVTAHNERLSVLLLVMAIPFRGLRYSLFDFNAQILRRINEPSRYGVIEEVYKIGGRKFGILNIGLYDCAPASLIIDSTKIGSCFKLVTELINLHNEKLLIGLRRLEFELSGFKYALHDYHTSLSQRINNPSKFGSKNLT